MGNKTKLCRSCDEIKDVRKFAVGNTKNELSEYCKTCIKERDISMAERNSEDMKLWGKGFRPKIRLKDWDQLE